MCRLGGLDGLVVELAFAVMNCWLGKSSGMVSFLVPFGRCYYSIGWHNHGDLSWSNSWSLPFVPGFTWSMIKWWPNIVIPPYVLVFDMAVAMSLYIFTWWILVSLWYATMLLVGLYTYIFVVALGWPKNAPWPDAWCLGSANDAKAEAKTWIRTDTKMCDLNGMLMMVY